MWWPVAVAAGPAPPAPCHLLPAVTAAAAGVGGGTTDSAVDAAAEGRGASMGGDRGAMRCMEVGS